MTTPFDPHAAIRELAEMEKACDQPYPDMLPRVHAPNCRCNGTGRVVPFAALRVVIERGVSHADCPQIGYCKAAIVASYVKFHNCTAKGWIPELDEDKADFRALLVLARHDLPRAQGVLADIGETGARGLAIRAALAWLEEQQP